MNIIEMMEQGFPPHEHTKMIELTPTHEFNVNWSIHSMSPQQPGGPLQHGPYLV